MAPRQLDQLQDPFKDRIFPPNFSSSEKNPAAAIGALVATVANGDNCSSKNKADYAHFRLPQRALTEDCKIKTVGPEKKFEKLVKGSALASINYIVGSAKADSGLAYEVRMIEVMGVSTEGECLDIDRLSEVKLPAKTCAILMIVGGVLTQLSHREFYEMKGDVKAAMGMVNVDGSMYGTSQSTEDAYVLTVDVSPVSQFFRVGANGFLERDEGAVLKSAGGATAVTAESMANGRSVARRFWPTLGQP